MNDKPERKSINPAPNAGATGGSIAPPKTYSLAELILMLGRQDVSVVEARVAGMSIASLVEEGGRASVERIVDDGVAIVGAAMDFLRLATPTQHALVATLGGNFCACAATALELAQKKNRAARHRAKNALSHRKGRRADVEECHDSARSLREVVFTNIENLVTNSASLKVRLDDAWGTSETAATTAESLDAMVAVGREALKESAVEAEVARATEALFERATDTAKSLRAAVASAQAVVAGEREVTAAEVDRCGGIALWHLDRLVRGFRDARKADPTIPKMPVKALKNVLDRKPSKRSPKNATPAPATPAPVAPSPATPPNG